jgi:hypothetical protein
MVLIVNHGVFLALYWYCGPRILRHSGCRYILGGPPKDVQGRKNKSDYTK